MGVIGIQRTIEMGDSQPLDEADLYRLPRTIFGGKARDGMTLVLQGIDSLHVTLWLRIEQGKPGFGTVLDFSHDAAVGCVLQLRSDAEAANNELCWCCSGFSLTSPVPTNKWIRLACGYDATRRMSWMSVDGGPKMVGTVPNTPFATKEVRLGLGHWLGGWHREFHGEIMDLRLAARGLGDTAFRRWQNEIIPEDCRPSRLEVLRDRLSERWETLVIRQRLGDFRNRLRNRVRMRMARVRKLGGVAERCVDGLRTSRWRISVSITDGDEAVSSRNSVGRTPTVTNGYVENFVTFVTREDVIGAAHFLNQILDMGCRVRASSVTWGTLHLGISDEPEDLEAFSRELLAIDMRRLRGAAAWVLTAALVSCAQTLYRRGDRTGSRTFLTSHLGEYGSASSHFMRDIELAQSRLSQEGERASVLVRNMAIGGLDYIEHFKGRYCNHPFDDFEIRSDGEIFVCCPSYLPYSIGNVFKVKSIDEVKSSERLAKLKDSIVRQDFRYCRWLHCEKIRNGLPPKSVPAKTEYIPVDFRLSYDPTCNLWCPSCRTEKIVAKGEQREKILQLTDEIVLPLLKTAHSCMMNGYGDVFASKACRKILEEVTPAQYPNLKFDFITNGVLFTREEWEKFPSIHRMVHSIRVSIDAAREATYDQIRLGGDWDVLMENLEFISSLRRQGIIERFMISMVIQEENFTEMADFARMAKRLGCEFAVFEPIMNWNTFTVDVFKQKAVHYSAHPRHAEFRHEIARVFEILPLANSQTVAKLGTPGFETLASTNF